LIATVAERLGDEPLTFTAAVEQGAADYRNIKARGRYLPERTVLVFTSLAEPRGARGGPGYWVMTPLALDGGGTIWVNRGFIPESAHPDFAARESSAPGLVTLSGVAIPSERTSSFTPAPNTADRIEWVRDTTRLSALAPDLPQPVASVYLDLPAGPPDALPQGGETVVRFPNNHLGYALTWFGLAILTPILLVFWIRQRPGRTP
jgi:surfeit locus 1 family protein